MNITSASGLAPALRAHARYRTRRLLVRRSSNAFSSCGDVTAIQRIHVINLDRAQQRWSALRRELTWFTDGVGHSLNTIARRFSAIDARYLDDAPPAELVDPTYTLAEQLRVDPHPKLDIDDAARATRITMTQQEIAVALSHIGVWKLVAAGNVPYSLVLEDDVYPTRNCMSALNRVWSEVRLAQDTDLFDVLYLSYRETGESEVRVRAGLALRRPTSGLWQLSGYVLTRAGAQSLLSLLPANGPIDMWINHQFDRLSVQMTDRPIIEQRPGLASSNSYSVLPILAKVGAIQREPPHLAGHQPARYPIVVVGAPGTGLSALAEALSVLGFRCISDLTDLPAEELDALLRGGRRGTFDAYVNIGSLGLDVIGRIAPSVPIRLIVTTGPNSARASSEITRTLDKDVCIPAHRRLVFPIDDPDPWERLTRFLTRDYPIHPWPRQPDQGQRRVCTGPRTERTSASSRRSMPWDVSPWIVTGTTWPGIALEPSERSGEGRGLPMDHDLTAIAWRGDTQIDDCNWYLRDDTFPGNRALFRPGNLTLRHHGYATLTLRHEASRVRDLTSAAVASRQSFTYGRFIADLRVPSGSGLVTGLFLHRNGPRQEIDIEIIGRDTTRMLTNVFYNPGIADTKLEYGYRGTPVLIDLGFDASAALHRYEIEWRPEYIRWLVDGVIVHERFLWGPTPIPNQRMELNLNLWASESAQFAGPLDEHSLPAVLEVASLEAHTQQVRSDMQGTEE